MTGEARRRGGPARGALVLVVVTVVAGVCLAACSTGGGVAGGARRAPAAPDLPTPMATSVDTPDGTWATLPMGRLDEALNTFWQLLFRRAGTGSWSDQVEATATATNGGLVLASLGAGRLVVGIRPSSYLTYTPMIATGDGARSWSNGLIDADLAARPDALAVGPHGGALALVDRRDGAEVLRSHANLSTWAALSGPGALARTVPGRACGLASLTAVGYGGSRLLVGGSCSRAGVVGLFTVRGGAWRLAGIALPSSLSRGRVEVLGISAGSARTGVLLAVSQKTTTSLVVAWSSATGQWTTSVPMRLSIGESVTSFGPANAGGIFVLSTASSGREALAVLQPGARWRDLPPPPTGTATVAFAPASAVDALAGSGTVLTVWQLDGRAQRWARSQVIHVAIQFGSSSQ